MFVIKGRRRWFTFPLLSILITSFLFSWNIEPVEAQEIVDLTSPTQVRVNANFWVWITIHYEVDGPIELNFEAQILEEETGDLQGEQSSGRTLPAGHHDSTYTLIVELNAPDSPRIWPLKAVLLGGNEWPFSIEVIDEDEPPSISIVSLEADPSALHVGDHVDVIGQVDYSIPDGSRFEIRYTTSSGIPSLFDRTAHAYCHPPPWIYLPEGATEHPFMPFFRAGEDHGGGIISGSGNDPLIIPANAPLEPEDWIWYFRIVYYGPDGEEVQMGSRELTIEVVTRSEMWAVIDEARSMPAVAGDTYSIDFLGRYFIPEDEVRNIEITIWDTDRGELVPCDPLREHSGVTGSRTLREIFVPMAFVDATDPLHLRANLRMDGSLMDFVEFEVPLYMGMLNNMGIEVIDSPLDVVYGSPFDVTARVNWDIAAFLDPISTHIFIHQPGIPLAFAETFIEVDGVDSRELVFNIPSEFIPPRNGEWILEAVVETWDPEANLREVAPFTVNVISAGEGIVGGSSDWMVVDGWPSIPTPFEGIELTFWAIIQVDTTDPLPQQVWLTLDVDGSQILREALTYLPDMDYYAFQSSTPWPATLGEHIAVFHVDPDGDYTDPNLDNNEFLFRFTVEETPQPFIPSEGEEPPPPEEEFNFYVTADPTERTLASSVSYSVNVELTSGMPEEAQLTLIGAPTGLSYSFKPSSGLPPYTSELTLTGSQNLPAASYSMMIKASSDDIERYKPILLQVEEGADYELSASPKTIQAQPGETVEYTISLSSDTGYSQYVNLAVSDLPSDLTSRLESTAGIPDFQTTLHINVEEDAAPRAYTFTVSGSGPDPHQTSLTLIIKEPVSQKPKEEDQSPLTYYLPLLYLIALIAAIITGILFTVRRVRRRSGKPKAFCLECGKKIPFGSEACPKCGADQSHEEE